MNLYEVGLEVIGNGLKFIRSFTIRRDAAKTLYPRQLVPGNTKPMGALFGNSDPPAQLLLQQVGFIYNPPRREKEVKEAEVKLTQEENKVHVLQKLVRAYLREELNGVLDPVC